MRLFESFGRSIRATVFPLAILALAACKSPEPEIPDTPVDVLYNNALDTLNAGNTRQAAKLFDEVERQHPYSTWATQAQLMSAYSYYLIDSYDDAIPALERFIDLHPGNRGAAYAYYLRSLCYYEQIADVSRDQGNTEEAQRALSDVIARFPNTPYARDATLKLDLVRDHLAGKEMAVGRYYMERGQYLAGINRFKNVIDHYQTTTHVPEALERLTEAYVALGIYPEAERAASVLGYNYPGSEWYQDAYNLLTSKGISTESSAELPPVVTDPSKAPEGPPPPEPEPDQATNDLGLPPPPAPVDSNSVIQNQTGPGLPPPPPAVPTPPVEEQPVPLPVPNSQPAPEEDDGGVFGSGGL
ncbi:outer membrane protein assembly factor BamD [Dongia sp.]|uniref:outer membrane protein assembly factor BamD n=1 Tax=Dongia sp. TaxID=1977262 RepID=UPI0037524415